MLLRETGYDLNHAQDGQENGSPGCGFPGPCKDDDQKTDEYEKKPHGPHPPFV